MLDLSDNHPGTIAALSWQRAELRLQLILENVYVAYKNSVYEMLLLASTYIKLVKNAQGAIRHNGGQVCVTTAIAVHTKP